MNKIILQPNVWTRLHTHLFQVIGQNDIRIALGAQSNGEATAPASDSPYFLTQGYVPKVINIADWGLDGTVPVYLMPHGDTQVTIVTV